MSRKQITPGQLNLIDQSPFASKVEIAKTGFDVPSVPSESVDPALVDLNPGVAVDLVDRANHLKSSMEALAHASMLGGLAVAGESHRDQLARRYQNLDRVLGNADNKRPDEITKARTEFSRAAGRGAMITAGWPKEQVDRLTHQEHQGYLAKFADSRGADKRKEYRRTLDRQMKVLAGQKLRRTARRKAS